MKSFRPFLFLLVLGITFNSCEPEEIEPPVKAPQVTDTTRTPDQILFGFRLKETVLGDIKWEALAQKATIFETDKKVIVDTIQIDFYQEGALYSTLTADSGLIYQNTNNMEAYGNVVIVTEDDQRLETDRLFWDNTRQKIYSDAFVTVTQGNDVLTGVGFETDPQLKHLEIKKNVNAKIRKIKGDHHAK
ncbi:MAG: LPS export ABC transporter periplasmic protein LptC [Gemmatimonadetes bacterium]|nr:MAG: LPS export ABC transporter periplasmic protein LptC [Gemmatimonadota bacterium]